MLSVVTWKWKPRGHYRSTFGPETVNILKQMVKRHYHKPHRFICVTDDPKGLDPDIKVIPLWDEWKDIPNPHGSGNPSCYRRLKLFSPEAKQLFGERFVSLDLDCVILDDLGPMWDRPEEIVLWGDTNPGTFYNGSMVLMKANCRPHVWNRFDPHKSPAAAKTAGQFGSDQGWISYCLGPNEPKWSTRDGIFSYRIHLRHRQGKNPPDGARIVMFHGSVDPWTSPAINLPWVRKNWRYDPNSKDGLDAINLVRKVAVFVSGRQIPIVALYDEEGDPTDDMNEAVSFVAGKDNRYWSGLLTHYRRMSSH